MYEFIELEYTGRLKDTNQIFDTTNQEFARSAGIFDEKMKYGAVTVCLGQGHILKGLEEQLQRKEYNTEFSVTLDADHAFGKKDAKLLKLIPKQTFQRDKVEPIPGLQVNIDGNIGTIRSVAGGRIIVDFNHPLSGKDIIYTVKILRHVDDAAEKIKAIFRAEFHLTEVEIAIRGEGVTIKTKHSLPEQIQQYVTQHCEKLVGVKNITFAS